MEPVGAGSRGRFAVMELEEDCVAMIKDTLELVKKSAAIPTMPQVAVRFLEITQNPNFSHGQLVELLSTDPGLAGEILRLANSALFGMPRKVTSLKQALVLLGVKRVRSLVLGRYMIEQLTANPPTLIQTDYYWRRSLTTGVLAARFAAEVAPQYREEAFLAGLFADVGVIALAEALPDAYRRPAEAYAPRSGKNFLQLEREALDTTHAEVSALMLEHWQLPEALAEAVRYSHNLATPDNLPADYTLLARLINGSGVIARLLCEAPEDPEIVSTICHRAMEVIGLPPALLRDTLLEIESDIGEIAELLQVGVIPADVYTMIADAIAEPAAAPAQMG
jgi:HD-like signal output (HDOD) protein